MVPCQGAIRNHEHNDGVKQPVVHMMKNRQPPLRTASLQPIADALIVLVDCHVTLPAVTIHEDLSVYRMKIE